MSERPFLLDDLMVRCAGSVSGSPSSLPGSGPAKCVDDVQLEQLVVLVQFLGGCRDGGYSWLPARCPGCGASLVGHRFRGYLLEQGEVPGKLIGRPVSA
jgi:hypothetical protein